MFNIMWHWSPNYGSFFRLILELVKVVSATITVGKVMRNRMYRWNWKGILIIFVLYYFNFKEFINILQIKNYWTMCNRSLMILISVWWFTFNYILIIWMTLYLILFINILPHIVLIEFQILILLAKYYLLI